MKPSAERKNPAVLEPAGLMGTAERTLNIPETGTKNNHLELYNMSRRIRTMFTTCSMMESRLDSLSGWLAGEVRYE